MACGSAAHPPAPRALRHGGCGCPRQLWLPRPLFPRSSAQLPEVGRGNATRGTGERAAPFSE